MAVKVVVLLLLMATLPEVVHAQERWPLSLEGSFGRGWGFSGKDRLYRGDRDAAAFALLLGGRLHRAREAGPFVALEAYGHANNVAVTSDCILAPGGGCVPWFPGFWGLSMLGGWETRSTALRVLAGPSIADYEADPSLGLSARIDVALTNSSRLAPSASVRLLHVPDYADDRITYIALGIGIRIR